VDKNIKNLIRNMGYMTIGNFASKILLFLLVPLYTGVLTTTEYGTYDAVVITVQILAPVLMLNISEGVMLFLLKGEADKLSVCKIGYRYTLPGIAILGIICLLNSLTGLVGFLHGYELFFFLYGTLYILITLYSEWAKGMNKVAVIASAGILETSVNLILSILFLLVFKLGITGFFYANILGEAASVLLYGCKLNVFECLECKKLNRDLSRQMVVFSVPLIFNTIGWAINTSLDKYCLIYLCGLDASALIAVAYKIPAILSTVYAVFTQAWQITAVNVYGEENRNEIYSKSFLLTNGLACVVCAVMILMNRTMSAVMFAKDFYYAWQYVPFLMLSALFNQTAGFFGPLLSAKKDSAAMAKAAVVGSILNLVLNIALIKLIGIQGAAVATALSSFSIFFVRWWFSKEMLDNRIFAIIYPTWLFLVISAAAEACGVNYYVQFICLAAVVFINRKQLMTGYCKIKGLVK